MKQNGNGAKAVAGLYLFGMLFQTATRLYVKWKVPNDLSSKELFSNGSVVLSILIGLFPFLDLIFKLSKLDIIYTFFFGKYLILPLQMLLFHENARNHFKNEHPNIYNYCQCIF